MKIKNRNILKDDEPQSPSNYYAQIICIHVICQARHYAGAPPIINSNCQIIAIYLVKPVSTGNKNHLTQCCTRNTEASTRTYCHKGEKGKRINGY